MNEQRKFPVYNFKQHLDNNIHENVLSVLSFDRHCHTYYRNEREYTQRIQIYIRVQRIPSLSIFVLFLVLMEQFIVCAYHANSKCINIFLNLRVILMYVSHEIYIHF